MYATRLTPPLYTFVLFVCCNINCKIRNAKSGNNAGLARGLQAGCGIYLPLHGINPLIPDLGKNANIDRRARLPFHVSNDLLTYLFDDGLRHSHVDLRVLSRKHVANFLVQLDCFCL
jgi:hypothetical protein